MPLLCGCRFAASTRRVLKVTHDWRPAVFAKQRQRLAGCGILGDSRMHFNHMFDICTLGFTTATASRRTASQIRGLNERRITTCTRWPRSCSRSAIRLPGNQGVVSTGHVDKKSTSLSGVSSREPTEPKSRTLPAAVEGGHPQDFVAMFSYALTRAHSSIIVPSGRGVGKAWRYRDLAAPHRGRVSNSGRPVRRLAIRLVFQQIQKHLQICSRMSVSGLE